MLISFRLSCLIVVLGCWMFCVVWAAPATPEKPDPQTRSKSLSKDDDEEDFVSTVRLDDVKQETSSGESEGVGDAPAFVPVPDKEQRGELPKDGKLSVSEVQHNKTGAATESFAKTRKSARTMALLLPAPRGQILDRKGEPFAQTQVAYQLALRFNQFENEERSHIVQFARSCLEQAHNIAGKTWEFSDEKLWRHYKDRRWLPLPITNVIRTEEAEKIRGKIEKVRGLELLPIYIRYYPEKATAAHIIGYVGSRGKLPTGPINHMDPLWEQTEGRAGLEKQFDAYLNGKPGVWRLMFDEEGNKILDELQTRPRPGGALVTTLDLHWQKKAEEALAKGARRGAMVVIDCKSGEVLVMASTPSYDPNLFIPNISQKDYDALRNDPARPLLSRAFQGKYPPASTFKVITVMSALKNKAISEDTLISCPAALTIGNHVFNNWSKTPAGSINCIQAIATSNNVFMYQAALRMGNAVPAATKLLETARLFGFGSPTGLPIPDYAGLLPDSDYMMRRHRRDFMQGDVANMSIGQGMLLASPLQVAHAMAAVGNGYGLPKLHLVKQIQDSNANVIYVATPEIEAPLPEYAYPISVVRKGMEAVVKGGTGRRAALSYTSIAGKSGTAQWGPEKDDSRLAWFAGFLPVENPRYAYAVLYEGLPGERIGGGAKAAPIVKEFFESIKDEVKAELNPESEIPVAVPVDQPLPGEKQQSGNSNNSSGAVIEMDDSAESSQHMTPIDGGASPQKMNSTNLSPSLYPQPGDPDYIPGLPKQLPRTITNRKRSQQQGDRVEEPPAAVPEVEDIPVAQPL